MFRTRVLALALVAAGSAGVAQAVGSYFDGFEATNWQSNTAGGWNDYFSPVTRVGSGTDGISAFAGSFYGKVTRQANADDASPTLHSGAFSRLGGYSSSFDAGFKTSLAVYIDLGDATVKGNTYGWDLSSAASAVDGSFRRDFIFHAASDSNGHVLIAGDNNSNFAKREDLAGLNHYEIDSSGWYVFESDFRSAGGVLAVDLNLRSSTGTLLWTETRSDPSDIIGSTVGGNRYMWFTFHTPNLAIDNTTLASNAVPEPFTMALCGAGLGLALLRRKRKA